MFETISKKAFLDMLLKMRAQRTISKLEKSFQEVVDTRPKSKPMSVENTTVLL